MRNYPKPFFASVPKALLSPDRSCWSVCEPTQVYAMGQLEKSLGHQSKFDTSITTHLSLQGCSTASSLSLNPNQRCCLVLDCSCKSAGKSTHVYMSQFAESMDAKKFTLFSLTRSAVQHISARNNAVTLIDCFSTVTSLSLQPYPGLWIV